MATANRTLNPVLESRAEAITPVSRGAPPQLLRCLVVSNSADRRKLIRAAAERQTWDAMVCRDAGEFLRAVFKRSVPLVVVDLPRADSPEYWALRDATDRARGASEALVAIAGSGAVEGEELWARKAGCWAYLSDAQGQRGFEFVLGEARAAVERSRPELKETAAAHSDSEDQW